jgi:hypothetical protein
MVWSALVRTDVITWPLTFNGGDIVTPFHIATSSIAVLYEEHERQLNNGRL